MGKGRYLKAAERACARKSRFETKSAAEAFVAGRYRAYRCVVCGGYHLTSGRGDREEPPVPAPKPEAGPKLGDLDWSAVLDPQPKPLPAPKPVPPPKPPPRRAKCAGSVAKDGRVLLVVEGKLVKSASVEAALRPALKSGTDVEVTTDSIPEIRRIV